MQYAKDIDAKMPTMPEEASMHADTNRSDTIVRFEGGGDASVHARTSQERTTEPWFQFLATAARS